MKTKKTRLPENCPQCGSPHLDRENPLGKIECPNCFWLADVGDYAMGFEGNWRTLGKGVCLSSLVAFIIFMGVQLLRWQQFSLEVSWFLLKRITAQATVDDWMNMGAICNSLEKFNCSVDSFLQVTYRQPNNSLALANLAIAHCQMGKWKQAQKYFEAYFSLSGEAFDTMFWYARTLIHLGEREKGVKWYYKALIKKPDLVEASTELVDHLMALAYYEEALSLIAHITGGKPEKVVFWGQKVVNLNTYMHHNKENRDPVIEESLKLPSLSGEDFYLPIWREEKGEVAFLLVDRTQADIIFPRELMGEHLIKKVAKKKNLKRGKSVEKVIVPRLRVGPWWLKNVKVSLCDGCQMRGGQNLLNRLHLKERTHFGDNFLLLSQQMK